jgi:hypothetical protein
MENLKISGLAVYSKLEKPLSQKELGNWEVQNPILRELYSWHNGLVEHSVESRFDRYLFLYYLQKVGVDLNPTHSLYTLNRLPDNYRLVLSDGNGDEVFFHSIDPEKPVLVISIANYSECSQIFDSSFLFKETLSKCIAENALYSGEEGDLEVDFDLLYEICSSMNPTSDYWRY